MQKSGGSPPQSLLKKIKKTVALLYEQPLPSAWSFLKNNYDATCYSRTNKLQFETGLCICKQCKTIILFQLSNQKNKNGPLLVDCLKSLSCHGPAGKPQFWSLQDFQLRLPCDYSLIDYSFAPGLTRISFRSPHLILHTCKLGPADARLSYQPLDEILRSLADIPDLPIQCSEDGNCCEGHRTPTIGRQLILRLKRVKPFVRAEIHHNTANNRLLAIVLESLQPIPPEVSQSICNNYEIIKI